MWHRDDMWLLFLLRAVLYLSPSLNTNGEAIEVTIKRTAKVKNYMRRLFFLDGIHTCS